MDHGHALRPTEAVLPLPNLLRGNCARPDRHRTERLTEDLSSAELMSPYQEIVNPVLWEIDWPYPLGSTEYWTLLPSGPPRCR